MRSTRPKPARKGARKPPPDLEGRLERLTELVDLVLAAALRGQLMPSERRVIKAYLEERRIARRARDARVREERGPACPACRGPLPSLELPRCPHCAVLLDVVRPKKGRGA
jgi:hypothetical protein